MHEIAAQLQLPMFDGMNVFDPVPVRTAVSDAQEAHQPLAQFDPKNDCLKVMRAISKAIAQQVEVTV